MRSATIILAATLGLGAAAQQDALHSRITVQGGPARLLGDIRGEPALERLGDHRSIDLTYERFLGHGASLLLGVGHWTVTGNDLLTDRADRALNHRTTVGTAHLGLRLYADNGRLLRFDARFAPFMEVGVGVGRYDVYGDLFLADGRRYHYWSDGTIRDAAQDGPGAADAMVVEQDGIYGTRLTHLATEEGKPTDPLFVFIPVRVGIKWRVSDRLSAQLSYAQLFTFTDRLDDVSGEHPTSFPDALSEYASNPTGRTASRGDASRNDRLCGVAIGLSYSFGKRGHRFAMPPLRGPVARAEVGDPPQPMVAPPAAPDTAKAPTIVLNVERVVVRQLVVDTLIVRSETDQRPKPGTLPQDTLEHKTPKSVTPADTAAAPSSKADTVDTFLRTAPDARKDTLQQQSAKAVVPADTAAAARSKADTMGTVVRTAPNARKDTLQQQPNRAAPADTVRSTAPIVMVAPVAPKDSLRKEPAPKALEGDGGTSKHTGTEASEQPAPKESRPKQEAGAAPPSAATAARLDALERENKQLRTEVETLRKTTGTASRERAVVAAVPPGSSSDTQRLKVLEDENAGLRSELNALRAVVMDTLRTGKDTAAVAAAESERPALKVVPAPAPRAGVPADTSAAQGRQQLNGMIQDRANTMERYMDAQDRPGPRAVLDSLRARLMLFDLRMDSLRQRLAAMPPATPEAASMDAVALGADLTMVMDTVTFALGSVGITPTHRTRLMGLVKAAQADTTLRILVTGHTDRSGPADHNLELSRQRAAAVAAIFREAGVPAKRIKTKGMGQQLARSRYDVNERIVVVQFIR